MIKFESKERGVDYFVKIGTYNKNSCLKLLANRPGSTLHVNYPVIRYIVNGKIDWAVRAGSLGISGWSYDPWPNDLREFCERLIKLESFE